MIITFGALAVFFAVIVVILQLSRTKDRNFTDYAVGGRSFGARYQAMSLLNTWYPGSMFTAFGGMAAASGVISFYVLSYSMLMVVLLYFMAKPVWVWGKTFDLRTQPDLLALRFDSRHIRTIAGVIGIVSGIPWLVLGMQALGTLFQYMSLGNLSFSHAVILGVAVIAVRQVWTVRMGMSGVVISDFAQGIAAYIGGGLILAGLIGWMWLARGITFDGLDPKLFALPGIGSKEGPLYLFSLMFTGAIGGWCWPYIFVRLFTANGVGSLKTSAALAIPLSLVFCALLLIFGMLASRVPGVAEHPNDVWFIVSQEAGGLWLLGLAGVVVLAASMGHTDGNIQATGRADRQRPRRQLLEARSCPADRHRQVRHAGADASLRVAGVSRSAGAVLARRARLPGHHPARGAAVPRHLLEAGQQVRRDRRHAGRLRRRGGPGTRVPGLPAVGLRADVRRGGAGGESGGLRRCRLPRAAVGGGTRAGRWPLRHSG